MDYRVLGAVPLEIYRQTKDSRYRDLGLGLADALWEHTTPDGITAEARYWIDDMYMIPLVQVEAFRNTGDAKYIDRAALAMSAYLDKLQQPNRLFFMVRIPIFTGAAEMVGWRLAQPSCCDPFQRPIGVPPKVDPLLMRVFC